MLGELDGLDCGLFPSLPPSELDDRDCGRLRFLWLVGILRIHQVVLVGTSFP